MMDRQLRAAIDWICIRPPDTGIAVSQLYELQRQIPFLYALLIVNASALSFTHHGLAPDWLTLGVLGPLLTVCAIRLVRWLKQAPERVAPQEAIRRLRRTTVFSGVLAISFVSWSLALDGYGGLAERGHVASFIAITVIACIFCLMHLPQAALLITILVTVPYIWYYLSSDVPVFNAIAVNILLVSLVMIKVLLSNFKAFVQLENSRSQLLDKHTETLSLSKENALLAYTDSLTGLPNRRYFLDHLGDMLAQARSDGLPFALGIFDLDGFKAVNDTYGHVLGDKVLTETAERLMPLVGAGVVIARLGGDEFGVLIKGHIDEVSVSAFGKNLCKALSQPLVIDDAKMLPGCSCGLVLYPDAGDNADLLFDRADYALYHAKTHSRGSATVFSPEHETSIRRERAIEAALEGADLDAELDTHFQPIVDLSDNVDVAMEALARWTSPSLGPIGPDVFIAVAERTGHIHAITLCLLKKALRHARDWPATLGLSFNLSARDINSSQTILAVIAALREAGLEPGRITFEITETAVLRDFDLAAQSIRLLRAFGCRIALDDFGTGYASLRYVHQLKFDTLKTDHSFLHDIVSNAEGRNIIKTALDLSRNLDLNCVVEGVEHPADLDLLRAMGCRYVQGYLMGRPMPADEVLRRVASGVPVHATASACP